MSENDAKVNGESTDSSNGNLDAERAVIGSCLLDNDVVEDCLSVLPASGYFTLPAHQELWDAIKNMHASHASIDAITIADWLIARNSFKEISGDDTLKAIVDFVPHAANGKYYAGIVRGRAEERREAAEERVTASLREYNGELAQEILDRLRSVRTPDTLAFEDITWTGLYLDAIAILVARGLVRFEATLTVTLLSPDYNQYIASPEWREKAEAAKEVAGQRCQVCNISRDRSTLDTHHRTYERLGHEEPSDLIVLCRDCHKLFHDNGRLAR